MDTILFNTKTCLIKINSSFSFTRGPGTPLPITDLLILLGGVGSFFFYRYAFGYGRAQHEKLAAIMFSFLFNMVLMIEVSFSLGNNCTEWKKRRLQHHPSSKPMTDIFFHTTYQLYCSVS